jgi:hypothetical protein
MWQLQREEDFINSRAYQEAYQQATRNFGSEMPRPLCRSLPDAESYPMEALGMLAPPAIRLHETIQAPAALCGQSILAAGALAIQGHRNVLLDGRVIPLSENFLTIGESGERKSAVDREALRPHRAYEKRLAVQYAEDIAGYENELAAYKKSREEALKKAKSRAAKKQAVEEIGLAPTAPLSPILLIEEPSYEGLIKYLLIGQPSTGLFSDDGGRMIGGYSMSEEQQLKTVAGLCELWDGKRISRVRSSDGATLLYGRRVSMHLMTQPVVAQRLLGNPLVIEQGFLSRCLITWPTSTAGTRLYKTVDLTVDSVMVDYEKNMQAILETPFPLVEGTTNELAPFPLFLTNSAKRIWAKFHDSIEKQLGDGAPLAPVRSFANKAPEHVLRLAGILTLIENLESKEIPAEQIGAGIILVQHYLSESLRLFHASLTDPDLVLAERLLAWAQHCGQHVALVDIYQRGPNAIRDTKTAKKLARILENHGWFVPVDKGMEIDGVFRRDVWEVKK